MKTIILHPGQIVFAIDGFEIVEATVVRVENKNQIILYSEYTSYQERQKTYGIDFFITEKKASKVLKAKLEKHVAFKNNEAVKIEEKRKEEALHHTRKEICNSCGLPVGRFSHCGCSY